MAISNYFAALVDEFAELGLSQAVISPGSRSTPLAMLFEEHPAFKTYVNIDERSAAFFALGLAKTSQQPAILVATSGSAPGHYLPAVMEASHAHIPLILLTSDRPAELRFTGAPQTTNQIRLFGQFARYFEELSRPQEENFWTYPRQVAERAYSHSLLETPGPVQVNIPIDEPLIPSLEVENFRKGRHTFQLSPKEVREEAFHFEGDMLILAGPQSPYPEKILALSETLHAPIFADPLSNLRQSGHPNVIDSYEAFDFSGLPLPENILQFGQTLTSKRANHWLKDFHGTWISYDETGQDRNPLGNTSYLTMNFPKSARNKPSDTFLKDYQRAQEITRQKLNEVQNETDLYEGKFLQLLQEQLPDDSQVIFANSMAIRYADLFWKSKKSSMKLFGNRGLNGIDGTISTALGVAAAAQKPTVLVTGDLALIHDLNALVFAKMGKLSLAIILFNNDGGGIFNHLAQHGQPYFERLFSTPHGLQFSALSDLVGLDYHKVLSYQDFEESLKLDGLRLYEVQTDKDLSAKIHKRYLES
ncbi:MAG: 2-succinyl-5-enolpyruvyl-6-hydroxy-3-cyclohexene-1-carboxylic-acid synthase [Streptococcaceae bacterium]|jgi:2-succinyl-5-enolpyruvyl-6-hydroxy-3-cyclohexene-1-carboxylate synthase|nr:2-succinyl-5-enolpyruvyl-6-hydroxy-3-cyclohexene-1-carboxylic-acid synthase [Streptococcaceae bacterium]